jgi:hypothetical protein
VHTYGKSAIVAPGTDRRFFTGMAVAVAVSVFAGFAPTHYLKSLYGTPALSPLFHFHGMLFTAWILLFLTQTTLIAVKRTDLHRRLGIVGGLLAVAMLVVGTAVAVASAKRGPQTPLPGFPLPLELLTTPLGALSSFAALVAAGLYKRRKRDTPQATDVARDALNLGRRPRPSPVPRRRACVLGPAVKPGDVRRVHRPIRGRMLSL